ncbi:hypothetical protein [Nocardioides sp. R-C-SC26]|uniref:hypothetical protein n=1 Tax=Nocardioides sp. R-C-SC26 TaxID=2870414 RepID=UPI001E652A79|nr:hypothetical protein [Nocardioides sp. R-C-SC26]
MDRFTDGARGRRSRRPIAAVAGAAATAVTLAAIAGPVAAAPKKKPKPKPAPTPKPALVVTDATAPVATLVHPTTGALLGRFALDAPGLAYSTGTSRYAVIAQGGADRTVVVDAASQVPTLLARSISGDTPVHVVSHDGMLAIFHDGDGSVVLVPEKNLGTKPLGATRIRAARPHHGVAVPLAGHVVISVPDAADPSASLPTGVEVRNRAGAVVESVDDCPQLHGEGSVGDVVAFGCADGVIVVEAHGDHWHTAKLVEPAEADPAARVGTLRTAEGLDYMVGNFGPTGLVRVDPEAAALAPMSIGGTVRSFALHRAAGGTALVLTTDGRIRAVDARTGVETAAVSVVPEFGTTGTRPTMTLLGDAAFVADPRDGTVTRVAVAGLKVSAPFRVGGAPTSVALAVG